MTLFLAKLPRCLVNHSKGRLLMAFLIAAAAGLQWFSWTRRHPIVAQRQEEIRAVARLEDEVGKLEKRWSEEEAARVDSRLIETHDLLFDGLPESGGWSQEVSRPGTFDSMEVKVSHGESKPHPRHSDDLLIVNTTWNLDLKETNGIGLQELLEFVEHLTASSRKRMDLVGLVVSGNGRDLTTAQLGLDLWFLNDAEDSE